MPDALAGNTARLGKLLERIRKEAGSDPAKYDELVGQLQRVLGERELIKKALGIQDA
jgi:hypothetical protein